jgi:hypothetical protein
MFLCPPLRPQARSTSFVQRLTTILMNQRKSLCDPLSIHHYEKLFVQPRRRRSQIRDWRNVVGVFCVDSLQKMQLRNKGKLASTSRQKCRSI